MREFCDYMREFCDYMREFYHTVQSTELLGLDLSTALWARCLVDGGEDMESPGGVSFLPNTSHAAVGASRGDRPGTVKLFTVGLVDL
jgi:hypothetical protein